MSIERMMAEIQRMQRESDEFVAPPATEEAIAAMSRQFQNEFGIAIPDAYLRVLRVSDGVMFDGLTIWPTHAYGQFRESLIDANRDLRETVEEALLYFGTRDEILFVFDLRREIYAALEMSGLSEWETFANSEALILFLLQRVVDDDEDAA